MLDRDTKSFYTTDTPEVAPKLLEFIKLKAGHRILDAAAATGNFVATCNSLGYDCEGIDINEAYVKIAQKKGLPVNPGDASKLKFADKSFDTVLLFEVLEHIEDKQIRKKILNEAKRVAKKNVLITTPNSNHLDLLYKTGLTYEHMLDRDHKVFWNDKSIEEEIKSVFDKYTITPDEKIESRLVDELSDSRIFRAIYRRLDRLGKASHKLYYRYYIVGEAD